MNMIQQGGRNMVITGIGFATIFPIGRWLGVFGPDATGLILHSTAIVGLVLIVAGIVTYRRGSRLQ